MVRAAGLFLVIALAVGCSSKPHVVVGSKAFTEQVLLGEILAQQIERRLDVTVERRLNLGGTLLVHEALRHGSVDLYAEYTGTGLLAVLKRQPSSDAAAVLAEVREGYRPWNLSWLDPLGFNNTFAMVVRSDMARAEGLRTLSDAERRRTPWRMGVGFEFLNRPDGLPGLLQVYDLPLAGAPLSMDLGLIYAALESRKIDLAPGNATDGLLARPDFTVLEDDRNYFPPYECAVVARDETLDRHPGLREALEELSGKLPDETMRLLNAEVDGAKRPAAQVAREFLGTFP